MAFFKAKTSVCIAAVSSFLEFYKKVM